MDYKGSCCCGQLQVVTKEQPIRVSVCHCYACQQRTGSAFGAQARFNQDNVTITGEATKYTRTGDGGSEIDFYFCPKCGSTVYYKLDPTDTIIPIGIFANNNFPAPKMAIYEERKHHWLDLTGDIERYD